MINFRKYIDSSYKRSLGLHGNKELRSDKQSIAFISFHKCATSFFSSKVFKKLNSHTQIDYLQLMYSQENLYYPMIIEKGILYGVLRLQDEDHPRYDFVQNFLNQKKFHQLKHIFWIRDPRDILVSMYYSFGHSHGYAKNLNFRLYQEEQRNKIKAQSLDEFALKEAHNLNKKFLHMNRLVTQSSENILLRYEDMVLDFDNFFNELNEFLEIDKGFYNEFKRATRPNEIIQEDRHKRSGGVGGYKDFLKPETVNKINDILHDILLIFNYKIEDNK